MKKMRARGFSVRKVICVLLAVFMAASLIPMRASASGVKADNKSRAIAIVLDNSGSMYYRGNQAWCRATYAIEVFAAMMNEGDSLSVYPMWDIEAGGVTYSSDNPLVVKDRSSISTIREIYTPSAGATPIETVRSASDGLKKLTADEKWLIVVTDGDEFYENDQSLGAATTEKLSEVLTECNKSLNVMYLGIGSVAVTPEVTAASKYTFYADKAADSATVLSKLTTMSNNIFGRDVLATSGNNIDFDISMRKLIVFVQGEGVSNITLNSRDGSRTFQAVDSYSPHYGERGAGGYQEQLGIDRGLQGVMMTYEDLDAGEYTIGFEGTASSVSAYYEPDVDMRLFLLDKNGDAAQTGTAYPGKFTVQAWMVDKNGQMTESALLGKTEYAISYTINGEEHIATGDEAGEVEIELAEGDVVDFGAEVTYLSGYHIAKSGSDMGWPQFTVLPKRVFGYSLELDIPQKYIVLSKVSEASAISANVYVNGEPATKEQCEKLNLTAEDTDIPFIIEKTADGTGFLLKPDAAEKIESGTHPFTCKLTGLDENDDPVSVSDKGSLTFKPYPQWLIFLGIFLLLLILAVLVWLYLNTKLLPNGVSSADTQFTVDGGTPVKAQAPVGYPKSGKKRTLTVTAPKYPAYPNIKPSIRAEVEAISPRKVGAASKRMLHVTGVSADKNVQNFQIGSVFFTRNEEDGKLVRVGAAPNAPVSFNIKNNAQCNVSGEARSPNGIVGFNLHTKLKFK